MTPKEDVSLIDIHVGEQLAGLRKRFNLSQRQIGEIVGVSYQQVQKYESGKTRLAPTKLMKLAARFDTTVSYFFETYNRDVVVPEREKNSVPEEEIAQLISLFLRIKSVKLRHSLIRAAHEYAERD